MAHDAAHVTEISTISGSVRVEAPEETVSFLVCNENVVKLDAAEGMNVEEIKTCDSDSLVHAKNGHYGGNCLTPFNYHQNSVEADKSGDIVQPNLTNVPTAVAFLPCTAEGAVRSDRVLQLNKYCVESFNSCRSVSSVANQLGHQQGTMLLEDLAVNDVRYFKNFPLSNGCGFDKDSVDGLSRFLDSTLCRGHANETEGSLSLPDNISRKHLLRLDCGHVDSSLRGEKSVNDDNMATCNGADFVGKQAAHHKIRGINTGSAHTRIQDVLLHLLPASSSPQLQAPRFDDGILVSTMLNYLAAHNMPENEQHHLVDNWLLEVTNAVTDARKTVENNSSRDDQTNRLTVGGDLFSDADLVSPAAISLKNSSVAKQTDNAPQSEEAVGGLPAVASGSSAFEQNSVLHATLPDSFDEDKNILLLPSPPIFDAYTSLKSSLLYGDTVQLFKPVSCSNSSKQPVPSLPTATCERVAGLVRKCLTVEIPVRHTCTFQVVDSCSATLNAAGLSRSIVADANAVLASSSDAGVQNSDVDPAAASIDRCGRNFSLADAGRDSARPVESTRERKTVDAASSFTTSAESAVEQKGKHLGTLDIRGRPQLERDSAVTNLISENNQISASNKFEAKKNVEGPDVAKTFKEGKRPLGSTENDSDDTSLLTRLATLGVLTENGKRRRLSLLEAYQPPLKCFYSLIDATATTKSATTPLMAAEKTARSVGDQLLTANILGTLESMQLVRSWFVAQLLAVRAETHPHTRLAKRQVLLRKYYNHLVSAYKLKKSAVCVREQASIDFDSGKKETNRAFERCKQALVSMFEDKRKLVELEKTLDIATNRYDLSRSFASTRGSRKTRGGPPASAAANADAELLLSLGAIGGSASAPLPSSASLSSVGGSAAPQQHHTLYPDHHDILGGASSSSLAYNNNASSSDGNMKQFMSATGRAAGLLRTAAAAAERQNNSNVADRNAARAGSVEQLASYPPPLFHRPQLFSSSAYAAPGGGAGTVNSLAGNSNALGNSNPNNTILTNAAGGSGAVAERPWLPTANSMLNFKKRRVTTLSQLLKTEIDEADMLSDLAYLNGCSQMMQNSSSTGLATTKRKRQTAIKSNVRVDSNRLMIDEHAFHRNQTVTVEPNPLSSAASTLLAVINNSGSGPDSTAGNVTQFGATILSFSAGEIWLRRSFDGQKFRVSIGQLMDGTYKLFDTPYNKRK